MTRTVRAARALHAKYINPTTAALNRANKAKSLRARMFWLGVGNFLFKPYPGQSWTDDDIARWSLIRA